jgi:hypothetical protein
VAICRKLKLLADGVVAVDGSKFKAVNNRDRNFTPHKLEQRMKQIQPKSGSYPDAGRLVGGLNGPSVDAILSLT